MQICLPIFLASPGLGVGSTYVRLYEMLTICGGNQLSRLVWESWYAIHVKELPDSLAKAIWPEDTKTTITQMFMVAVRGAENSRETLGITEDDGTDEFCFTYKHLYNSWLYRWANEEYGNLNGDSDSIKDMKRMLFDVVMYA